MTGKNTRVNDVDVDTRTCQPTQCDIGIQRQLLLINAIEVPRIWQRSRHCRRSGHHRKEKCTNDEGTTNPSHNKSG